MTTEEIPFYAEKYENILPVLIPNLKENWGRGQAKKLEDIVLPPKTQFLSVTIGGS